MLAKSIERFLRHEGLWSEPVGLARLGCQRRMSVARCGLVIMIARTHQSDRMTIQIWVVVKEAALARKLLRSQLDGR